MSNFGRLAFSLFVTILLGSTATSADAEVKGDINNDDKIDLVESIYALRVISQSTGSGFVPNDLEGKTFFEVHQNSMGNQICIIEFQYGPDSVSGKEWRYINDDSWLAGCEEEYIPGEEAVMPYTLNNGVIEIDFGSGEGPWQTRLVEKFADNYLTSNMDGTATWYFTKDKVNSIVDPQIKFTQDILSANYWYVIETNIDDPDHPDCNGKFDFDGNITLNVQWQDGEGPGEASAVYALHTGSLISNHDQKVEIETISTYSPEEISTVKTVLREDGGTDGTGSVKKWFRDKSAAESFLNNIGIVTTCFPPSDGTVKSAGRIWMDRNLGASQVATSSTDSEASGDLYQWGRLTDGHEKRTSSNISGLSTTDDPGHGDFILHGGTSPYDWRNPQNDSLWQGVTGINNPCPSGFRLPTKSEFEDEISSWGSYTSSQESGFASPLKLPLTGTRNPDTGSITGTGFEGLYWTSTVDGANSYLVSINPGTAMTVIFPRAQGFAVRCIKD